MAGCIDCTPVCDRVWNVQTPASNISAPYGSSVIDMSAIFSHSNSTRNRGLDRENFREPINKGLKASICVKLTIFVGLLVVLSAGIPALVLWFKTREQLLEEIERRLFTVSTLRQEQLRDYLYSETDKTELIGTRILINSYLINPSDSNKSLAEFDLRSAVEVISDFVYAGIYNNVGQLVLATEDGIIMKVVQPSVLQSLEANGLMISYPAQTQMGWIYNISRAIYQKGLLRGVLLTGVNATKLVRLVYDRTGLQGTGELLVAVPESPKNVHLLLPPLQYPHITMLPREGAMSRAVNGESGITTLHDYRGTKVIAAYRPVGFMHWGLVAKLDISEAYAPIQNVKVVVITTIVILVTLGVMASLGLAKIFASPIVELGKAAVALGHGDMTARVKKGTLLLRDEIADLKDTFNSMAHQISSHQSILEHKVYERTSDLASANEGLGKEIEERKRIEFELEKAKDAAIAANRLYGGTGLGLVISYKLAVAMGGSMWVESDGVENHGSTFWFTAKFRTPPACITASPSSKICFEGMLGLVVDDNKTCGRMLVNLLRNWGVNSDAVTSVEEALYALKKGASSGQKYNIVFLDMWLNGTDASQLIAQLREKPTLLGKCGDVSPPAIEESSNKSFERRLQDETSSSLEEPCSPKQHVEEGSFHEEPCSLRSTGSTGDHANQIQQSFNSSEYGSNKHRFRDNSDYFPSIILLTSPSHTDASRCQGLGVRYYVSKPIKQSLLLKALKAAVGAQKSFTTSEDSASKKPEAPARNLNILVAEDNVVNQRVVVILLQKWGHTPVIASNGAEAVERASKEAFDLILMDVQMPICDGFSATAQIRELERTRRKSRYTPIVAMTAHAMSGDGDRCLSAGMDFYISKPLNAKKLQELLYGFATGAIQGPLGLPSQAELDV